MTRKTKAAHGKRRAKANKAPPTATGSATFGRRVLNIAR